MRTTARPRKLLVRKYGKISLEVGSHPLQFETIGSFKTCVTLVGIIDMSLISFSTFVQNIFNYRL